MELLEKYGPVLAIIVIVLFVYKRLPRIDVGHSDAFRKRRFFNWFPLGLTYAFLYMGRYNLTVSKNYMPEGAIDNADFGTIFGVGTVVYGVSFVINGPLTDRIGGKKAILIASAGAAVMNAAMGFVVLSNLSGNLVLALTLLYAGNMYFQSFGAVSIVKVNASWFHVRERGAFGGIFGVLISLGIFLAFDVGRMIAESFPTHFVFFVPAAFLATFFVADTLVVRDTPGEAGMEDFDPQDASSGDDGPRLPVLALFAKMLRNPVILTIALIEFCSGFLRNAIMHWYYIFAKQTGIKDTFVPENWGLLLFAAGVFGGVFAGQISDRVFGSRRGPVASILYGGMLIGSVIVFFTLDSPVLGAVVIFMSLCIIGVHGMLSGTASMDFGGRKNVGTAVGIIDGFVYLGTGLQAFLIGAIVPTDEAAKDPNNWMNWPIAMAPVALIGLFFASRIWNSKPQPKSAPAKTEKGESVPPPATAEKDAA